jgi:hypothetical protein
VRCVLSRHLRVAAHIASYQETLTAFSASLRRVRILLALEGLFYLFLERNTTTFCPPLRLNCARASGAPRLPRDEWVTCSLLFAESVTAQRAIRSVCEQLQVDNPSRYPIHFFLVSQHGVCLACHSRCAGVDTSGLGRTWVRLAFLALMSELSSCVKSLTRPSDYFEQHTPPRYLLLRWEGRRGRFGRRRLERQG